MTDRKYKSATEELALTQENPARVGDLKAMADTEWRNDDRTWLIRHPDDGQWAEAGFRDDIVRAFAEWVTERNPPNPEQCDTVDEATRYLASLAAKEEER